MPCLHLLLPLRNLSILLWTHTPRLSLMRPVLHHYDDSFPASWSSTTQPWSGKETEHFLSSFCSMGSRLLGKFWINLLRSSHALFQSFEVYIYPSTLSDPMKPWEMDQWPSVYAQGGIWVENSPISSYSHVLPQLHDEPHLQMPKGIS